jgi:hypothetical protein
MMGLAEAQKGQDRLLWVLPRPYPCLKHAKKMPLPPLQGEA